MLGRSVLCGTDPTLSHGQPPVRIRTWHSYAMFDLTVETAMPCRVTAGTLLDMKMYVDDDGIGCLP
jgi:hypothetical protein